MNVDRGNVVAILRRGHIFQGLELAHLARIADFFEPVELEKNQVVFLEGSRPDYFYIVLDGRVQVTRRTKKRVQLLNFLGPGDFFGEQAFIFNSLRSATIKTVTPTTLLRMSQTRFNQLLSEYPGIRLNLTATAQSRKRARNKRFSWLGKEEILYYIAGRHVLFLIRAWLLPFLLLAGSLVVLAVLLFPLDSGIGFSPILFFPILGLIIALLWGAWIWIDWSNDYFIVTSQRVIWQEKILVIYDSRHEATLSQILAVNVSSSQIGRILNYGNVDVRTYTGSILMRNVEQAYRFAGLVDSLRKRASELSHEQEIQTIDETLGKALFKTAHPEADLIPAASAPSTASEKKAPSKKKQDNPSWWRTFLKVRYQEGKVITYRKHWLLLLAKIWTPFVILLLTCPISTYLTWNQIFSLTFFLLLTPFFLVIFGWLVYDYLDWSNDIYRLTPDQILDIERKPLGQEQKKTASLGSPDLRVEHTRANIWGIIFDFGTVTINVGQTQFIFNGVYNPDQVHKDVSDYQQAFMHKKEEDAENRRKEEMLKWLTSYHRQQEKLENEENNPGEGG
ncbi:MAG: cyclic nucleotide-binding domain-containing protein [Anaerolineales bacterium]|nr:cyclic nucleotide-binding domain-containing protein [Anaerolineales bacterium]